MPKRTPTVAMTLSPKMIEDVFRDYEREHPGMTAESMPSDEFADRMMEKIAASARILPSGAA